MSASQSNVPIRDSSELELTGPFLNGIGMRKLGNLDRSLRNAAGTGFRPRPDPTSGK